MSKVREVTINFKTRVDDRYSGEATNMSNFRAINLVKNKLTWRQRELFRSTCFGHLLDIQHLKFPGCFVHQVLLREVETVGLENQMWFLISGKLVRFSQYEFGLISGLRVGSIHQPVLKGPLRLRDTYLQGRNLKKPQLDNMLDELDFSQIPDEDAVKLALFYFLERFLICTARKRYVSRDYLRMVDDMDLFNGYPWGSECYNKLVGSLSEVLKNRKKKFDARKKNKRGKHKAEKYDLFGCPYVFMIWMFEAMPFIGSQYGISRDGMVPRILKWTNTRTIPEFAAHKLLDRRQKKKENKPIPALVATSDEASQGWHQMLASFVEVSIAVKLPRIPRQPISSSIRDPEVQMAEQVSGVKHLEDSQANIDKDEDFMCNTDEVPPRSDHSQSLWQQVLDSIGKLSQEVHDNKNRVEAAFVEINNRLDVIGSDIKMLKESNNYSPFHHPPSPIDDEVPSAQGCPPTNAHRNTPPVPIPDTSRTNVAASPLASPFVDVYTDVPSPRVNPPPHAQLATPVVPHDGTPCTTVPTGPVAQHVSFPLPCGDTNVVQKHSMFGWVLKKRKQLVSPYTVDGRARKRPKAIPLPSKTMSYEEWKKSGNYLVDLGICTANPSWFVPLELKDRWLNDGHVDAWLYMLRAKQRKESGWGSRSTSMDCFFYVRVQHFWQSYGDDFTDITIPDQLYDYFDGISPLLAKPWDEVDEVLIPVNMPGHWVLVRVDIIKRSLTVYDSLLTNFSAVDVSRWIRCLVETIPLLLQKTEFGQRRPQHCTSTTAYKISRLEHGIPQQRDWSRVVYTC